jgi:hypothetical protein
VCQNCVHSGRGSVVLVDEAAEAIAAVDIAAGHWLDLGGFGLSECEPAVSALAVVDAQDVFEVAAAEDQQPVETLVADGADEPFRVRVRLWGLHRRVDDLDSFAAEQLVEGGGELAVAVVDQETRPLENAGEAEVARLLDGPRSRRVRRATSKMDTPLPSSIKNST